MDGRTEEQTDESIRLMLRETNNWKVSSKFLEKCRSCGDNNLIDKMAKTDKGPQLW